MADSDKTHRLFVRGRLCLFGEHSDWAANYGRYPGYCLVVGTDQGLRATARAARELTIETRLPDAGGRPSGRSRKMTCDFNRPTLQAAAGDSEEFFRYCAGVACEMASLPGVAGGLELRIDRMDLPLRKGVSSSAAVCILVARAFDAVYGLDLFPHELMDIAYRGERLTGSQCGRMDQACIYGKTPVLLAFGPGDGVRVEPVSPGGAMHLFLVDLGGQKDTVRILADLQGAYLASDELQQALGPGNEAIVRRTHRALTEGDTQQLGYLMTRAQEQFDSSVAPHSPAQLASPLLHEVLASDAIAPHVWGGKGVGSQGDGTAQFVARSDEDRKHAMEAITRTYPRMQCFPLDILPLQSSDSALS